MIELAGLSLAVLTLIFIAAAVVIACAGTKMAYVAVDIAAETGWGQAIVGAVFIGISTSLSGVVLSMYAAAGDHPDLSISNSLGGIPAQTAFLAVADLFYRRINLEHAAASLPNIAQGALLIVLLSIPLTTMATPEYTIFWLHPTSFLLILVYLGGMSIVRQIRTEPMWTPRRTSETQTEQKEETQSGEALPMLFAKFTVLALILGGTGVLLTEAATTMAARTGLSENVVGTLFTAVTTSLPELITTLAAVRSGALNLAVGNIIGGNSFDVLFLSGSDAFYKQGSLYHQFTGDHVLITAASMLMIGVFMLGLLRREKKGPAGIGFESTIILGIYALLVGGLFL